MDGGRETNKKMAGATQTIRAKENRGEMGSGAPAREIREEGGEEKMREKIEEKEG